jgi:hypothetical protein
VLGLGLLSTIVALLSAYRTNRILQTVVAQSLESVRAAQQLEIALLEQRGFVSAYLLAEGQGDWLNQLQRKYATFDSWFQIAGATARTDQQRETLRRLASVYRDYLAKRERVVELYHDQSANEAKRMLLQDVQSLYEQAYALCEDFIDAVDRDVVAATTRAADEARWVTWAVAAFVALTWAAKNWTASMQNWHWCYRVFLFRCCFSYWGRHSWRVMSCRWRLVSFVVRCASWSGSFKTAVTTGSRNAKRRRSNASGCPTRFVLSRAADLDGGCVRSNSSSKLRSWSSNWPS